MSNHPFNTIEDLSDIKGKRILVRAELNAPQHNGEIVDDSRLVGALKTISYLSERGAVVIIIAHASGVNKKEVLSLSPVQQWLSRQLTVTFINDYVAGEAKESILNADDGNIFLFENLRKNEGEEKNDPGFAQALSEYGEIYINDAFPASHRNHASIVGIPKILPSYAGIQFEEEYAALSRALNPQHPFLFILGGAKFETKLPLAEMFLDRAETVFLGGGLLNPVLQQKGFEVGTSLMPEDISICGNLDFIAQHGHLMLPIDVVVERRGVSENISIQDIRGTDIIVDIGKVSIDQLKEKIRESKFVLWNGPLGHIEKGHKESTIKIAEAIRTSDAYCIIGGGDSLGSIESIEGFDFVSTAGGAMLEFLLKGTLPGIQALI